MPTALGTIQQYGTHTTLVLHLQSTTPALVLQRNATQRNLMCHLDVMSLAGVCSGTLFGCNEEGRLRRMQSECIGDDQRLVIERDHLLPFEQRKVLVEVNLLHTVSRMTTTMFEGG
jgi:hypothetical protein